MAVGSQEGTKNKPSVTAARAVAASNGYRGNLSNRECKNARYF
jgi:hypothetical protein